MPYICPGKREIDGPAAEFVTDQGRDPGRDPDPTAAALETFYHENKCAAAALARDAFGIVNEDFCRICAHLLGRNRDRLRKGIPLPKTK